jgi:RimJ/RimL family protein N-acetyltransferase
MGTVAAMRLQPYGDSDLALTRALENDPVVMRHLGGIATEDRAQEVHAKRMAGVAGGDWYRTVTVDGDPEPVGLVAIWRSDFAGQPIYEIGAMVRPGHHGKSVGVTASKVLIEEFRAAGTATELHCFSAIGNVGAERGARASGFTPIGECDLDYEGQPLRCVHWVQEL